jgi:hypothetical protein
MTRRFSRPVGCLAFLLCAGAVVVNCGRSDLDLGAVGNTPVTTGAAGDDGAAGTINVSPAGAAGTRGAAGTAAIMTGAAGAMAHPTGAAGTIGMPTPTGAAGTGVPVGPAPIPCGTSACMPIGQKCCIEVRNGPPSAMCIDVGATCDSGTSFSCVNTASCGGGAVCCVSTQNLSTTCSSPAACLLSPGLILCSADADCPALLSHCCGPANLKVCTQRACGGGGRPAPPPGP